MTRLSSFTGKQAIEKWLKAVMAIHRLAEERIHDPRTPAGNLGGRPASRLRLAPTGSMT
jgi:hypothetical protein